MAKYRKLGRTSSQRKALIRSQVTALLHNGRIITTEARAKEVRKVAEGLIAAAVKECDNFEEVTAVWETYMDSAAFVKFSSWATARKYSNCLLFITDCHLPVHYI